MSNVSTIERQPRPIEEVRTQLEHMEGQFKAALPAHIPVERFSRVVMTAIQNNGELMKCDRRSLWNAAMRAAQDGLLPDGREGAIVHYQDKNKGLIAQWMPMIGGLRKKARNSGEISTWETYCVYENDKFEFELGDNPFIRHAPALGDKGKLIAAYSVATLKDGSKSREVMSILEIEGVRSKSKAKFGPWSDPIFFPEMVRKTVARRHSKVLPMSSDLDDLIRQDDALYDLEGARNDAAQTRTGGKAQSLAGALDKLALPKQPAGDAGNGNGAHDTETGEVIEGEATDKTEPGEAGGEASADEAETAEDRVETTAGAKSLDTMLKEIDKLPSVVHCADYVHDPVNRRSIDALSAPKREQFDQAFMRKQDRLKKAKKD